jgi:hypothetical protein
MTKSQLHSMYKNSSAQDGRTFNRWLAANAIVGLTSVAVLIAMALVGSKVHAPQQATAKSIEATDATSSSPTATTTTNITPPPAFAE